MAEADDTVLNTTIDDIYQEFRGIQTFVTDKVAEGLQPVQDELKRLVEGWTQAQKDLRELRRQNVAVIGGEGNIIVPSGRYLGFSPMELMMARSILSKHDNYRGKNFDTSPRAQEIDEAYKMIADGIGPEQLFAWAERGMKARRAAYGFVDFGPGVRKFEDEIAAWRTGLMDIRQKALDSTTAGSGDELVSTIQAAQLWMDVNLDTVVLPILNQVPMPSNPFDTPLQLGDANWYPISENVQGLTTDPATQRVTLSAKGLRAGVPFSDELEEDAIIALVPELRRNLARNAAEVIDDVLLNADQTVTNGINSDGATIATDTAGKAQWLLGFDGLIHLALVDNSANQSNDHSAAVSADMFNEALSKLGKYAAPRRRGDVAFISDVNTAIRSLSISEFETVDVAGARATLSTGEILSVYGKPYLHSEQMALADADDGKVTDSGNSTNTGRLLVLNTSQWRVGFRRQITMESDRNAGQGQTTLYTTFRIALTERSGTRSTATHTAIQFGIEGVA